MTGTHCRCGAPATRTDRETGELLCEPSARVRGLVLTRRIPTSTTAPDQIPDAVVAAAANRPAKRYPGVVSRTTAAAVEEPQRGGARV